MTAIRNILSAVAIAFFVASCGISGEGSETGEQELATSIDEICEASPAEDCEAAYEVLYSYGSCEKKCQKYCEKNCKNDNHGCKQSCKSHCKKVCGRDDKDHASLLEVN